MAGARIKTTVRLDEYGSAEITPLEGWVHVVLKSNGQELNLTPQDAYYFANALELHARELGYDPEVIKE